MNERYVIRAGQTRRDIYDLELTTEKAGWHWSSLRVLTLRPGVAVDIHGDDAEFLVLPLSGSCVVTSAEHEYPLAGRDSVFTGITDYVYVPRRTDIRLLSAEGASIALPASRATRDLPVRYCPASDVITTLRGAGVCSRQVNNYALGNDLQTSHLLVCEVLTPGGNWSSYPPHKHDEHSEEERVLEEIYYYRVRPSAQGGAGFALQCAHSSPDHTIDVCTRVYDGDMVLMPHGYHGPSIAAPGHDLYYLNVMAGPAEDAMWLMTDDPEYAWVRSTWEQQEVDSRLPMTPMN